MNILGIGAQGDLAAHTAITMRADKTGLRRDQKKLDEAARMDATGVLEKKSKEPVRIC